MLDALTERLHELYPEMVEFRRDLHMYPELSFEEERTPAKIAEYLQALGLQVRTGVGGRGVVATIEGAKPGRTVALRADFDALPIQEETALPFASKVPGKMHACGHDLHTAALLGVAKVLAQNRESLSGRVVLIHQFAEEIEPGGALPMIEDGCLEGVDVVYGAHVWSPLPYGTVACRSGEAMAAADSFTITVSGKGGHGAMPHTSVDPIAIGAQLVVHLQQIVSRNVDPLRPAVLTVGAFHAGNAPNVIPDSAELVGTVRTFHGDVQDLMEQRLNEYAQSVAMAGGATATVDYRRGYPALINHDEQATRVRELAAQRFGEQQVIDVDPVMGGEDFAYYLQRVPGAFFYVGGGSETGEANYPHHHPRFDVDERSMLVTGELFLALVLAELGGSGPREAGLISEGNRSAARP